MNRRPHHVVVIGGGFGGMNTAKAFKRKDVDVTLVDKQNYHLFWPLLYQVATAGLSPGDIAAPLRAIFAEQKNVNVRMADVTDIDPDEQLVHFASGERIRYDSLVVAAGFRYHYFGNEQWREHALDLQGVDKALDIRDRILSAYEKAEQESNPARQQALLTFVVVGAGPTGVELAGSIVELAHHSLKDNFRRIDPTQSRVLLLEAADRVLPAFPEEALGQSAACAGEAWRERSPELGGQGRGRRTTYWWSATARRSASTRRLCCGRPASRRRP